LADTLLHAAENHPDHGVSYVSADGREQRQTYPQLLDDARRILAGLRGLGLTPGARILFQLDHNPDFVPALWAAMLGGFVPVPLSIPPSYDEDNAALAKLHNACEMLGQPLILTSTLLQPHLARCIKARSHPAPSPTPAIAALETLRTQPPTTTVHHPQPDDLALLLLTSGSTGRPKAVQLSHRNILCRSAATAQHNQFGADEVSLNWMPLDHVGGLVMFHVHDVFVGCNQLQVRPDYVLSDPLRWLDLIERHRVSLTWAPNFAFGLVNAQLETAQKRRWDLRSLRFILNGGEAIVSPTARRFLKTLSAHGLPATAMHPAWGMSETASGVTFSESFTLNQTADCDAFVAVGRPIPGTSVRIVDRGDAPVEEGQTGSLQVKGLSITAGYLDHPALNHEAFTADGWFKTGDQGVLRDGQLAITGREKDVIIIYGANFYSHEIEAVVEGVDGVEVSFTAACGVRTDGHDTDQLVIFYCPRPEVRDRSALEKSIRQAVLGQCGINPDFIVALTTPQIPKTAIGKIQRTQLKKAFEASPLSAAERLPEPRPNGLYRKTWRHAPPRPPSNHANPPPQHHWVFLDRAGALRPLVTALRALRHHTVVVIEAGAVFGRTPLGDHFHLSPRSAHDHFKLVTELISRHGCPHHITYAWTLDRITDAQPKTADELARDAALTLEPLLRLSQALAEIEPGDTRCTLRVIAAEAQAVHAAEPVRLALAQLPGWLRSLPEEIPWLAASLIDLPGGEIPAHRDALFQEINGANGHPAHEIVWRGNERRIAQLEAVPAHLPVGPLPLKTGGCYLISGGLGGIGLELTRHLIDHQAARVVVVGRSARMATEIAALNPPAGQSNSADGELIYEVADVTDLAAMTAVAARAQARWGVPFDGVFHLAGVYAPAALNEETTATLAAATHPKLGGAWTLFQLVKNRPGTLFVNFSSVLGYFGGYRHSSYAAANSALDGFAHELRRHGLRGFSLGWCPWRDRGMNRGLDNQAATRAQGFCEIEPAAGLAALEFALRCDEPFLLVGLDGENPRIRRELGIDVAAASAPARSAPAERIAPRTPTEKSLARLWSDVLKRPELGVHDNFFELGGKSLQAARLFARIDEVFGQKLPLATLFKAPTIAALAARIDAHTPAASALCRIDGMQTSGLLPPLFCVPGGASDNIVFRELSALLPADQPLYGLQAAGLDATAVDSELVEIEAIAGSFLREIRAIQPRGPYFLAGHCFGGLLIYEVAQILVAQGEQVRFLGLIESMVGTTLPTDLKISLRDKLAYHWGLMRHRPLTGKFGYLAARVIGYRAAKESRRRLRESFGRVHELHRRYHLKPYPGKLTLLMAADSFFTSRPDRDPRLFWQKMAGAGAQVIHVAGDHDTLLQRPHVHDLAEKLTRCLARARGETPLTIPTP
jgi:acyl-CoA synthetase (AMP-forming)/AMP-acid ligase II/thioesterase domain-containing protein/NAD(P)-dependent dehydrogenase (short-subunit alcohol dehydrogenase family)/acyl carrier protein